MKKHLLLLSLFAALPLQADTTVDELVHEVMDASGYASWDKVDRLEFTFRVVIDGEEKVSAKHDWNITANTDKVTWAGKTVSIDLGKPGTTEDEKAAFQRWTNDAYWLIAPLKLKDSGAVVTMPAANSLQLAFKGVGLTPGDQYIYQFNEKTHLPESWVYMPAPDKKNVATWEKYITTGGLTLSTYHKMGKLEIFLDDVKVIPKS